MESHSAWLNNFFVHEYLENTIQNICKVISILEDEHECELNIATRGLSGNLVGACVARELKRDLMVVRTRDPDSCGIDGLRCHSSYKVENLKRGKYIILDDLISSQKTVKCIHTEIEFEANRDSSFNFDYPNCIAIVLYRNFLDGVSRIATLSSNKEVPIYGVWENQNEKYCEYRE